MTHSKAFSRREALILIGAAAATIITGHPAQAKKRRGSRGSGTTPDLTKPDTQTQPSQSQPIRPNKSGYLAPIPCDTRYSNCNATTVDENFNPGPMILLSSTLLGGGWLVQNRAKVAEFMKEFNEAMADDTIPKKQISSKPKPSSKSLTKSSTPPKSKQTKKVAPLTTNSLEGSLAAPVKKLKEKAEWYVFRSGNAEGPYTKGQLRDVQRITARTSVKREGQEDWVKAGSIEELASFLTN
ncbi:DUF4339 domain-containing protein [Kamptonema sp. UHCC 0994]|uniref:DUF4339 domain-containing protein n=1 Tax=Kamptonema sp. UHCC 0994 TaxID=3031329 RepID=UPI0023B91A48|nr:DUF4339 domain-containing protein [Kamptonema sp. UHCC 0994]MDF0552814.1 DUF4339 domain-containing protein [Kamptonema sp. UHCC 0994]